MAEDFTFKNAVEHKTNDMVRQQEQPSHQEESALSRREELDLQDTVSGNSSSSSERPQVRRWWKFKLRPPDDEDEQ